MVYAEVARAVYDELVELLERAVVEEELDALARSPLTRAVLSLDARRASALFGEALAFAQLFELRPVFFFDLFGFHKLRLLRCIMNE